MCSNSRPMAAKSILPIGFRVKFTDQWGAPKRMMSIQPLSCPITDIPESVSNVCKNICTSIMRKYSRYSTVYTWYMEWGAASFGGWIVSLTLNVQVPWQQIFWPWSRSGLPIARSDKPFIRGCFLGGLGFRV